MADSNLVGFDFDPRNVIRNSYPTSAQWSNQFDSPHQQPSIGANANAIKPSQVPLDDPRMGLGPMNQQYPSRTQSQEQDYGYSRPPGQQNPLPADVQPQNTFQQQYTQHLLQQQAFAQQYQTPPVIITQTMTSTQSTQSPQSSDQSSPHDWSFGDQITGGQQYSDQNAYGPQTNTQAFLPWASSSVNLVPQQPQYANGMTGLDDAYMAMNGDLDGMTMNWQELPSQYAYRRADGMSDMRLANQPFPTSPTDTSLEVRSLSSSDNGWTAIDFHQYDGSLPENQAIFNPSQTLHCRTLSDSSYSDAENHARLSWNSSLVDVANHMCESPTSDGIGGFDHHEHATGRDHMHIKQEKPPSPVLSTSTTLPIKIKTSRSPQRSPIQKVSPPSRRQARKNSIKNGAKAPLKKQSPPVKIETEKRIGRRKGPLRPEQRKQAADIRKLGACLRCKFLKKTCDKGEPCQGCLPSHARLWQVPCTRIDIKEIAYFMKDWKADVNREHILHFSVDNIIEFAKTERSLYISHGYGHVLHVYAREIYVRDERVFGVDWVETYQDQPTEFSVNTAKMSLGVDGISEDLLSKYLDCYIDDGYEHFIEQYFEGTPFVTEMMITVYRYYLREPTPVLRKTLKFLLAYNLTQHVTYVEGLPVEEDFTGKIFNNTSKFNGKTVAPVMINFSVKIAMAKMWRELQKEILEELSAMYSSVYSKEKLRNWPTIFMVACILLAVWEEMQFDCHYRVQDKDEVNRFCNEMESIPVKVVVGLFHAISQKLPSLQEWETRKHHTTLNSNPAICDALTEVRHHVTRHDQYLRSRCDTKFDSTDFDSLSSKFMSKLVIRTAAA